MRLPASLIDGFSAMADQADEEVDVLEAALLTSKILRPSAKTDEYREKIDQLAKRLGQADWEKTLTSKVQAFKNIMAGQEGFHGDEEAYEDLDHMNLFSVLDYKCGTALSLSILYVHCARANGWAAHALNFPGYSLVCLEEGAQRVIIDPFHECAEMDAYTLRQLLKVIGGADAELTPQHYDPLSPKTLAVRHLFSIKAHFLRCVQIEKALEILEALTVFEPKSAAFWRETGLLQARIGEMEEAAHSLKTAIKYTDDADAIRHTQRIIRDIETKLKEDQDG